MKTGKAENTHARRTTWLAAAVLGAATCLAYANSFSVPLIFDDWVTIQHNPKLRQLWPIWEAFFPPEYSGVGGRPVANLSFVLNYALTGESMAGFHCVNLVIHLGAALALFGVVRRTLLARVRSMATPSHATWVALAVAGLWALQPVQTQSVTYVSQRTELLMGLFYFLTLYGFVRATESGGRASWRVLSVLACAAGMASKEGMVTAPVTVFIYDYAFVAGSWKEAWRKRWRFHLSLCASWILLALLLGGLRGRGVGFGLGLDPFSYLLIECGAVVRYLTLGVWPWPLVFDYGVDFGGVGAAQWASAAGLSGLALLTVWALVRKPAWGFIGAWFFVTLAPTSSVVPIPLQPISENRVYVPLAAVITAGVLIAHAALGRRGAWAGAAIALAGMALTLDRNRDYHREIGLWTDTIAKRPESSRARNNLGYAYQSAGRLPEAQREYEHALRLRPDYGEAHVNLGGVLGQRGDIDGAIAHSRRATELDPRNANAFYNLGVGLRDKGRAEESIAALQAAVRLKPDYAAAHDNLAWAYLRAGQGAAALQHSEAAVRASPQWIDARYTLVCALILLGRHAEAIPRLQDFLRAKPDHLEAWQNLAGALNQVGRTAEAAEAFQALLRINPNHALARLNLGHLLLNAGNALAAAEQYAVVTRLLPQHPEGHAHLGWALVNAGKQAEGVAELNRALELDPNSALAREILEKLRTRAGATKQP